MTFRNRVLYARVDAASERAQEPCPNGDLLPVFAVVWIGSVARVAAAVVRHETFGSEVTLALFTAVVLSFVLIQDGWWLIERARSSSEASAEPFATSPPGGVERVAFDGRGSTSSPAHGERAPSDSSANVISLASRLAARRSSSGLPET